jgi:hypothetical protein
VVRRRSTARFVRVVVRVPVDRKVNERQGFAQRFGIGGFCVHKYRDDRGVMSMEQTSLNRRILETLAAQDYTLNMLS